MPDGNDTQAAVCTFWEFLFIPGVPTSDHRERRCGYGRALLTSDNRNLYAPVAIIDLPKLSWAYFIGGVHRPGSNGDTVR